MLDRLRTLAATACLALQPAVAQPNSGWQDVPGPATVQENNEPGWTKLPNKNTDAPIGVRWTPVATDQTPAMAKPSWSETPADATEVATPPAAPAKPSKTLPPYTWPNGQPMSPEDRRFYSTAFSRGSLIQIGDTIYPNLGFNALQRQPSSWVSLGISAIGTSRQSSACRTTAAKLDFFDDCADALFESYWRILNGENYSFDLQWTVHSLSGAGSPLPIAGRTGGTEFGEGQSLGFKLASNLNETFGLTFGANRLVHLDETTDLPKNLYLMGTKVFILNESKTPPIISLSLGLMSDVYNPNTNLGTMQYPKWLLGGIYPSLFAQTFDPNAPKASRGYYPNVAGVTSPYVCAQQSIFAGKPLSAADPNCIKQVTIGPVASVGFAPWPWIGMYAKYTSNITLALSLKPFKQIPWTFSFEAIAPINGINPIQDRSLRKFDCNGEEPSSFSACRTRYGVFTQMNF